MLLSSLRQAWIVSTNNDMLTVSYFYVAADERVELVVVCTMLMVCA